MLYPISTLPASMRVLTHPPDHSFLPDLAFPYTRAMNSLRPKDLSSFSASYVTSNMGSSMCILCLVVYFLGASGVGGGVWSVHTVIPSMGLKTPQLLETLLQFLHQETPNLSNGWLWASTSVSVRFRNSLSGDSHIKLTSASTSQHPSCLGCKLLFMVVGCAEDQTQYFVHAGQALCQLSWTLLLNKHSLQIQAFDSSPVFILFCFILFHFYCPFHASPFPVTPPQTPPPPSPHSPLTWWGCSSSYSPTPTSQI